MKLRKLNNGYYSLYDSDGDIVASNNPDTPCSKKLSKENCDEMFGVIDVEKLACDECHIDISAYKIIQTLKSGHSKSELQLESKVDGFILGFNKSVALNKNKLFTVEDVRKAMSIGLSIGYGRQFEIENKSVEIDSYIQSLQQPTEIEVEMIYNRDCYSSAGWCDKLTMSQCIMCTPVYPLKDENGCLILKKK